MPSAVLECTPVGFSDASAADTPDVRLPASSVEPVGRHRTILRLDRAILSVRLSGQHLHSSYAIRGWSNPGAEKRTAHKRASPSGQVGLSLVMEDLLMDVVDDGFTLYSCGLKAAPNACYGR